MAKSYQLLLLFRYIYVYIVVIDYAYTLHTFEYQYTDYKMLSYTDGYTVISNIMVYNYILPIHRIVFII